VPSECGRPEADYAAASASPRRGILKRKLIWQRGLRLAAVVLAAVLLAFAARVYYVNRFPDAMMVDVGRKADDWTLSTPSGRALSFYANSGDRPSVILFWATWCPSCRKLMPALEELKASLPAGSANFYALNVHEEGDPEAYMRQHGYDFELLLEAEGVAKQYGMYGIPRVVLVDPDKTVRYTLRRGTSDEQVVEDLRWLLKTRRK